MKFRYATGRPQMHQNLPGGTKRFDVSIHPFIEGQPTRTVSETLLKLRLEKRHKDLADPQLAPYSNLRLSIDRSDPCVPSNA